MLPLLLFHQCLVTKTEASMLNLLKVLFFARRSQEPDCGNKNSECITNRGIYITGIILEYHGLDCHQCNGCGEHLYGSPSLRPFAV